MKVQGELFEKRKRGREESKRKGKKRKMQKELTDDL
jgi:hypothetical protein